MLCRGLKFWEIKNCDAKNQNLSLKIICNRRTAIKIANSLMGCTNTQKIMRGRKIEKMIHWTWMLSILKVETWKMRSHCALNWTFSQTNKQIRIVRCVFSKPDRTSRRQNILIQHFWYFILTQRCGWQSETSIPKFFLRSVWWTLNLHCKLH